MMALESLGPDFTGLGLKDSIDALEKLTSDISFAPDFIFLDVNMPKINGVELLEKIKSLENLKNTSIFIYTTSWDHRLMELCKGLGAKEYLIKPYTFDSLVDCLKDVLIAKVKAEWQIFTLHYHECM